jgi:O-acetylserine/cysteine efflux transporter
MKPSDVLIALMVPLIWGMGLVIAKPAVDQFPPILLMALRFSVTALLLVWFVPVPKGMRKSLALVALVGSTLQYGLSFNGLKLLDASTTALIVQVEAPFLLLISAVWLGDRLTIRQVAGLAIAFVGIYILTGAPNLVGKWVGISLTISGAFMWALGQVLMRRLTQNQPNRLSGMGTIAWVSVFAAPQLFVASLIMEDQHLYHISHAGIAVWGAVAYLGVVMTAIGYTCWYHVLGRYPASQAGPYLLLLPVFSILGGWLFLGEPVNQRMLIGGAIIVFGVALLTLQRFSATK